MTRLMIHLIRPAPRREHARRASARSTRPTLESLEDRLLLYTTYNSAAWTGPARWTYGSRITYSFMPDGTNVGGVPSSLYRTMNSYYSTSAWKQAIEQAAAVWQAAANINLALVPDNGKQEGASGNQQDDPYVGDIRIGAIPEGSNQLAFTLLPPPANGGTNAGDIFFNSTQNWGNSGFDLETVAIHEFGHALGLGESTVQGEVMYAYYQGVKQTLSYDDATGIQSLYGAIPADTTNNSGIPNITPYINGSGQIALSNLNITSSSDNGLFFVTVPSNTTGTMTVSVQSKKLSSLSPGVFVYDGNFNFLGETLLPNSYGATATYTVNVQPGQGYYILAAAADLYNNVPGSNGAYGLLVNFGSQSQAPIAPPNTVVPSQPNMGGGSDNFLTDGPAPGDSGQGGSTLWNWWRNWLASSRDGWGNGWADPSSPSLNSGGTPMSSGSGRIQIGSLQAWGDGLLVAPGAGGSTPANTATGGMGFVPGSQTRSFPIIIAPPFSASPTGHFGAFNPTATGSSDPTLYYIDLVLGNWSSQRHQGKRI
jgi:hypothetical protein